MTASANRLPVEVWLNIFDRIQDKQQLLQCKLVCKRWTPLVDKALLKTVVLTSNNTLQLWEYLVHHPKSERYIQVIDVPEYTAEDLPNILVFLSLAITPSLRELNGSVWTDSFINIIAEIAARYPADSLKLEKIPGSALNNDGYVNLVYQVRKTLRFLHLALVRDTTPEYITKICDNLHEFKSLVDLRFFDLQRYIDCVPKMDDLLRGLDHLESLELNVDQHATRRSTDILDTWLSQNVQKVDSVKSIKVSNTPFGSRDGEERDLSSGFNIDLLRYLSFKYPKVQHVDLDFYEQDDQPIVRSLFENADTVTLRKWEVDHFDEAEQIMDVWKSQTNSLGIHISEIGASNHFACKMNVHKVKATNHTKFVLKRIDWDLQVEESIQHALASLGNALTEEFALDLEDYQDIQSEFSPMIFLSSTPLIQQLKMKTNNIRCDAPLAPLTRLHTLELTDTSLTAQDVAGIATWAPQLKHLKLNDSSIEVADGYMSRKQDIHLPELALSTFTMKAREMLSSDLQIVVTMSNSQTCRFYAAPSRPLIRATPEDNEMYFSGTTTLSIECKSLKYLNVNLSNIHVELEFDEEGNVTRSVPEIKNSVVTDLNTEIASLKTDNRALATKYEKAKKYLTEAQIQAIEDDQDM